MSNAIGGIILDRYKEKTYYEGVRSAEGVKKTAAMRPLRQTSVSVSNRAFVTCKTQRVCSKRSIEPRNSLTISGSCLHRAAVLFGVAVYAAPDPTEVSTVYPYATYS